MRVRISVAIIGFAIALTVASLSSGADAPPVALARGEGKVDIIISGQPVATYFYDDKVGASSRSHSARSFARATPLSRFGQTRRGSFGQA